MANPDGELTVAQRLGRALDRGLLPAGGPAEAAERLIERLERPARVALLGLPGSGKSSILNLLVGAIVVPETLRLPTIVVQHGDVSRMICTLTDGTTKILPGHDLADVLPLAPALVTLEMDLPALRVIGLLEVSAGPMEAEQKRAATWASKRADIVIWCTTSYLPKEQAVWESLPDAVKDNSFMFLTKVDLLGNRDAAQAMHSRVELRAGEEFRQILSISAKQARAAMPAAGAVNRDLFRDSGATAVIAAIKTRVQSGRRADMDTAELLLARHVEASELVARRFADGDGDTQAKAWTPPPEPAEPAITGPDIIEPPAEPAQEPIETAPLPEVVEPEAEPEADAAPATPVDAAPKPELAEAEATAVPTRGDAADAQPGPETAAVPAPPSDQGSTTRRRFADRIKRVAADGDPAPAPLVPLKTTWKSKADTEAPPEPEPAPTPRPAEPTRRPRTAAAPVVEPDPPSAPEPDEVVPTPEPVEAASPEPEVKSRAEPVDDAASDKTEPPAPDPRERRPRAVTPRPESTAEAERATRPQLFGARRGAGQAGSPLPDLSSLRATPEEIAASAEAREDSAADQYVDPLQPETEEDWVAPSFDADASEPLPESDPEPAPMPATQPDRPRLFDRVARARPADLDRTTKPEPVARSEPVARGTPISRMPAPQRAPSPLVAEEPASNRPALDEAQFSPRAIMMRERRVEPEAPTPRRERPRIAARAVAAPAVASPQPVVSHAEHGVLDEAIGLITARSADLEQEVDPEGKVLVDLILDHARDTVDQVMAVVSRGQSEALRKLSGEMGEVVDLIMLMQLEKGHAPADDALTLILQLKRELETLRAA